MTVAEFRQNDSLPGLWARELATNNILNIVLSVMDDNHPARYAVQGDNDGDISPTRATLELGLTRGYSKYGDTLKLLAKRLPRPADLGEPTYENPPVEIEEQQYG